MDLVRHLGEGLFIGAVVGTDCAGRIHIGGRADRAGDGAQGQVLAVELLVPVPKFLQGHGSTPLQVSADNAQDDRRSVVRQCRTCAEQSDVCEDPV